MLFRPRIAAPHCRWSHQPINQRWPHREETEQLQQPTIRVRHKINQNKFAVFLLRDFSQLPIGIPARRRLQMTTVSIPTAFVSWNTTVGWLVGELWFAVVLNGRSFVGTDERASVCCLICRSSNWFATTRATTSGWLLSALAAKPLRRSS